MGGYGLHSGMTFVWVVPILIVIAFIFYFNNKRDSSAKDILDERYAKGEIDTQEYAERLKKL